MADSQPRELLCPSHFRAIYQRRDMHAWGLCTPSRTHPYCWFVSHINRARTKVTYDKRVHFFTREKRSSSLIVGQSRPPLLTITTSVYASTENEKRSNARKKKGALLIRERCSRIWTIGDAAFCSPAARHGDRETSTFPSRPGRPCRCSCCRLVPLSHRLPAPHRDRNVAGLARASAAAAAAAASASASAAAGHQTKGERHCRGQAVQTQIRRGEIVPARRRRHRRPTHRRCSLPAPEAESRLALVLKDRCWCASGKAVVVAAAEASSGEQRGEREGVCTPFSKAEIKTQHQRCSILSTIPCNKAPARRRVQEGRGTHVILAFGTPMATAMHLSA